MAKRLKKRVPLIGHLARIYKYVNGEYLPDERGEKTLMECLAHLEYYHNSETAKRARALVKRMKEDLDLLDNALLRSDLKEDPTHMKKTSDKDKENLT